MKCLRIAMLCCLALYGCGSAGAQEKASPSTIIFFDTSVSMWGYFGVTQDASFQSTMIQRYLWQDLFLDLSKMRLGNVFLSRFDEEVKTPERIPDLFWLRFATKLERAKALPGKHTNLIGVFEHKWMRHATTALIITDGIQDVKGILAPQLIPAIQGIERGELKEKGFYIWIVGIRSEFKGKSNPKSKSNWDKKYDARVYPVCFDKAGRNDNAAKYEFEGRRPIYIWVCSKDLAKGEQLTGLIMDGLRRYAPEDEEVVRVVELSAMPTPKTHLTMRLGDKETANVSEIPNESKLEITGLPRSGGKPVEIDVGYIEPPEMVEGTWKYGLKIDPTPRSLGWVECTATVSVLVSPDDSHFNPQRYTALELSQRRSRGIRDGDSAEFWPLVIDPAKIPRFLSGLVPSWGLGDRTMTLKLLARQERFAWWKDGENTKKSADYWSTRHDNDHADDSSASKDLVEEKRRNNARRTPFLSLLVNAFAPKYRDPEHEVTSSTVVIP